MILDKRVAESVLEPVLYRARTDDRVRPGATYGPIVREVYIVECNTGGSGTVEINGKSFPISEGDCYILLPGDTVRHTASDDPRRGVFCSLGGKRVGQILSEIGITSESPFAPPECFDEVTDIIKRMIVINHENDMGADLRRTALVYELLGALTRGRAASDRNHWVKRAMGIFEANYHTDLTVADVAAEVGFDRAYFSIIFKQHTGMSPHAYLTSLRIGQACSLISDRGYSVSEAAVSVGLDPRNFARLFSRETGMTPSEYKRKNAHTAE